MPMSQEERATLDETNRLVKDLHTSLIGTSLIPGAVPTIAEQVKSLFKRVRALEHWRSLLVGMGILATFVLSYFKAGAK